LATRSAFSTRSRSAIAIIDFSASSLQTIAE
jgi:hypothetical protein